MITWLRRYRGQCMHLRTARSRNFASRLRESATTSLAIVSAEQRRGERRQFDPVFERARSWSGKPWHLERAPPAGYPGRCTAKHIFALVHILSRFVGDGFSTEGIPRKWRKYAWFYLFFTLVAEAIRDTPSVIRGIGVWRLFEKEPLDAFCNTAAEGSLSARRLWFIQKVVIVSESVTWANVYLAFIK